MGAGVPLCLHLEQHHVQIDASPVTVNSLLKLQTTEFSSSQCLSRQLLKVLIISASTTESGGKLLQILTILEQNENFLKF